MLIIYHLRIATILIVLYNRLFSVPGQYVKMMLSQLPVHSVAVHSVPQQVSKVHSLDLQLSNELVNITSNELVNIAAVRKTTVKIEYKCYHQAGHAGDYILTDQHIETAALQWSIKCPRRSFDEDTCTPCEQYRI